jgi:hypothetical protein
VRRNMLAELNRVLEACPAKKLGFVLTGAQRDEDSAYGGYYYGRHDRDEPQSAARISRVEQKPESTESIRSSL